LIGEIDKTLQPKELKIYLCKPDRTRIAFLSEAKNKVVNYKYNDIHEFTFTLPYKIRKNNKTIHNPHIDIVRGRYLLEIDGEFFLIDKFDKNADSKIEFMNIHAYHLPYELRDKDVRAYKDVKTIEQALTDTLLKDTDWRIEYIDGSLAIQYRAFDVSESTLLQFIFDMAEMFKAVLYWDSKNKTVSFYKQENLGTFKGLYISDKKYLKQIMESIDFDSVCTRLKCYGKDGLTFNDISPTGQNYIENFSCFMYPYSETIVDPVNDIYTVNSHSYYMSDDLCHAIIKYNSFVDSKLGEFTTLLNQKDSLNTQLTTLNNEMVTLQTEYAQILDNLDVANANGQPTGSILAQKTAKESQINAKQAEINTVNNNLNINQGQITSLMNSLAIQNHFTPEQIAERNNYIIVRSYSNNSIITSQDLYDTGVEALNNLIYPPINITLNIVNFLKVVNCQNDWDKISIGSIVQLHYPNFGISIRAKILSMQIDYENNSIDLTIGNYKRLCTDEDYMREMLYKTTSTSTQVDMNKMWWDEAQNNKTAVGQLLNNIWDANAREIKAGINESVEISARGIKIKDPNDSMNYLVAQHGILAITNDGGNSWKNALTRNGVVAERLYGNIIAGEDLTITTTNGDFLVNQLGVQISNLTLSLTRSDNKTKVLMDATNGIKIQSNNGVSWDDVLSFDATGKGLFRGNLDILGSLKINGQEALTNNKLSTNFIESLEVGKNVLMGNNAYISWDKVTNQPTILSANDIKSTVITKDWIATLGLKVGTEIQMGSNATISWDKVTGTPSIPTKASDIGALPDTTVIPVIPSYIKSTYIDSTSINSPTITGGTFRTTLVNNKRIEITSDGLISYNASNQKHGISFNVNDFGANYSRMAFYNNGSMIGVMEATNSSFTVATLGGSSLLKLYGGGGTKALGNWDFSEASSITWGSNAPSTVAKFG